MKDLVDQGKHLCGTPPLDEPLVGHRSMIAREGGRLPDRTGERRGHGSTARSARQSAGARSLEAESRASHLRVVPSLSG
jgi:hypothetical protein